jgi:hypothetical protein
MITVAMVDLKTVSRVSLGIGGVIFLVYFLERLSASARVPIELFSVPATTMFPLLLIMSLFVGASFLIESHLASR